MPSSRWVGAQRGTYLVEPIVVRLDAHAVQDFLDVLGAGGRIAPEGGQEIGGNVAHPEGTRPWRDPEASGPHPGPGAAAARGLARGSPPRPTETHPAPCSAPRQSPKAPARPAAWTGLPTHSAAAKRPHACDRGGVRKGKESAGAGGGGNPLPRSLRGQCAAPRDGASK